MLEQITNEVLPTLTTVIVLILTLIIKALGNSAVGYIESKKGLIEKQKEKVVKETTATERELLKAVGKDVWSIVEEEFRTRIEPIAESKIEMFNRLLLQKVPGLTQSQIDEVRQAIAGEVNKGKQAIINDDSIKQQNLQLQDDKAKLIEENKKLKDTINTIQNVIPKHE